MAAEVTRNLMPRILQRLRGSLLEFNNKYSRYSLDQKNQLLQFSNDVCRCLLINKRFQLGRRGFKIVQIETRTRTTRVSRRSAGIRVSGRSARVRVSGSSSTIRARGTRVVQANVLAAGDDNAEGVEGEHVPQEEGAVGGGEEGQIGAEHVPQEEGPVGGGEEGQHVSRDEGTVGGEDWGHEQGGNLDSEEEEGEQEGSLYNGEEEELGENLENEHEEEEEHDAINQEIYVLEQNMKAYIKNIRGVKKDLNRCRTPFTHIIMAITGINLVLKEMPTRNYPMKIKHLETELKKKFLKSVGANTRNLRNENFRQHADNVVGAFNAGSNSLNALRLPSGDIFLDPSPQFQRIFRNLDRQMSEFHRLKNHIKNLRAIHRNR